MALKDIFRGLCPPLLWRAGSKLLRGSRLSSARISFTGDYSSWEDAQRESEGYSAANILEKTRVAMSKVKSGESAFERDSLVFDVMEFQFPLLSGLLYAAAQDGRLSVLDFGGALGSSYFQCRSFIRGIRDLRWSIVEQPGHVACGEREFADEQLRFYSSADECVQVERPNVLLLSGVVQCLPEPYKFTAEMVSREFRYVIVDRTAFMRDGRTRLTVEHVPEYIYKASYPSWFLSEEQFLRYFETTYRVLASFAALDTNQPEGGRADYKGFIFELRPSTRPLQTNSAAGKD